MTVQSGKKGTQQKLLNVPEETEETKLKKYKRFELRTNSGLPLDEVVSGLQKAVRRGLEERALYFMQEMVESNFVGYFWRRMSIIVLEDIGLADPQAVILINSLCQMNERLNKNKPYKDTYCTGMAVLYLCRANKSREVDYALDYLELKRKQGSYITPNDIDKDCHTESGREKLRHLSQKTGRSYDELVNEKFYFEGIVTNKPVSVEGDYWKNKVWEERKLHALKKA